MGCKFTEQLFCPLSVEYLVRVTVSSRISFGFASLWPSHETVTLYKATLFVSVVCVLLTGLGPREHVEAESRLASVVPTALSQTGLQKFQGCSF